MTLYSNETSREHLEAAMKAGAHALLLSGPEGVGLMTIAQQYADVSGAIVSLVLPGKDEKIDLEKGTITIASVRRLYEQTRTVEPKGRIVIIDYVERMAPAAQNAFLKLLEEPVEGTRFMLLSHQPQQLLPTIHSRVQHIVLRPITKEASNALLDELLVTDATKRTQLLFIAEGLPAALKRLVQDDELFKTRAETVKDARTFVTGTPYDRLLVAKKYKDTRPGALLLVEDALRMLQRTLEAKSDANALHMLTRLENVHKRLSEQGNIRLQLFAAAVMV